MTKRTDLYIEQEVIRLYTTKTDNGWMGGNEISKRLGITDTTVRAILNRNGIRIRSGSEAITGKRCKPITHIPVGDAPLCKCGCGNNVDWNQAKNKWNVYFDNHYRSDAEYKNPEWLKEQYNSGRTLSEIAKQFGVFSSSVKKFAKKFGMVIRPHGETLKLRGSVKGENNPSWKGGVTPDRQRIYKTGEWVELVKCVYARDGYKCQRCGCEHNRRNKLHAHHLRSWADNPHLRLEASNLITLCDTCHSWVHSRKNTKKEFIL